MNEEEEKYIDSKFAEVANKEATERKQAQAFFQKRKAQTKIIILVCTLIMLGLLGFMLSILWKYQIAPRL